MALEHTIDDYYGITVIADSNTTDGTEMTIETNASNPHFVSVMVYDRSNGECSTHSMYARDLYEAMSKYIEALDGAGN